MKKNVLFLFLVSAFFSSNAQTNVSGGIYANTTWTLANSPYIVVDTVVVFPNITLTIEAGVIVKFENNKFLEVRQGTIIAEGTNSDSITFTSNSSSPATGIWDQIYLRNCHPSRFNFCNFYYAYYAIQDVTLYDTITIKNSTFRYNYTGIYSDDYFTNCLVDSCNFSNNTYGADAFSCLFINNCKITNNQTGIKAGGGSVVKNSIIDSNSVEGINFSGDSLFNCELKYNGTGMEVSATPIITSNIIESNIGPGIDLHWAGSIYCNRICGNGTYDLQFETSNNLMVANNFWCTSDSSSIESQIYDGYDNTNLGLISFMPIDILMCYLYTDISNKIFEPPIISISPNPTNSIITITNSQQPDKKTNGQKERLQIFNLLGKIIYTADYYESITMNCESFLSGIYFVKVTNENGSIVQKLVKQ